MNGNPCLERIIKLFCVMRVGFIGILLWLALPLWAEEASKPVESRGDYSMAHYDPNDSTVVEVEEEEQKEMSAKDYLLWPFSHIIQPALDLLVYPFSAPVKYAAENRILEKSADLAAFGPKRNIYIYPTMNLKPGTRTQIGIAYRHRNMLFQKDYFVANATLFVNSDMKFSTRYTKRNLLGSDFVIGGRLDLTLDRDATVALPRSLTLFDTDETFIYTDSSYSAQLRLGHPLPFVPNMDFQIEGEIDRCLFDLPDVQDTVLTDHPKFNPNTHGLYQNYYQFPLKFTLTYDNIDAPFVPTRGSRISATWRYVNVTEYAGANVTSKSNSLDHDYQAFDFVAQHYFYLGKDDSKYGLTAKEAREFRKFYTDFSWDETLRLWRPENIKNTLLNRRVLAIQFRMRQMWEMEEGGAPFSAFSTAGGTYPLRGYTRRYADFAMKGISLEYRWPIDRLVDGVLFDEYVSYGRNWYSLDGDKLLNSWGFGIRVRKPDMYLFRIQIGFHGFNGFALVCTVAPEFQ